MAYGDASPYPALPNLPPNPDVTQQVVAGDAAAPAEDMKPPPNYLTNDVPPAPQTAPAPVAQPAAQPPAQKADPFSGVASAPSTGKGSDPFAGVASAPESNESEISRLERFAPREAARMGRSIVGSVGSLADVGLLPMKTAILGAGMATGNKELQRVGMTPTMADTMTAGVDQATGGVLKPQNAGEKANDVINGLVIPTGIYGELAKGEPLAADAVKAAPGLIDAGKAALNPMQTAGEAVQAKLPVPNRVGPAPSPTNMTADQQRAAASKIYKTVEKAGGAIAPSEVDTWLSNLGDHAQSAEDQYLNGPNGVTSLIQKLTSRGTDTSPNIYRTQPMTPQMVLNTDKAINAAITPSMFHTNGKMTEEGQSILSLKNSFLDMVDNATNDPSKISGGPEGFRAIQDAKDQWSQALGAQQVQQIIDRGKTAVGSPATSIANGFRTLLNNPNRMRAFKNQPDVVAAIKYAANTGMVTGLLKTMGSRLNAVGLGLVGAGIGHTAAGNGGAFVGELAGNAAGYLIGEGPRQLATKLQTNRGQAVIDAIRSKNLPPDIGTAATAVTPAVGANVTAKGTQTNQMESDAHAYARAAIAAGAPRDAVIKRLYEQGYGPGGL